MKVNLQMFADKPEEVVEDKIEKPVETVEDKTAIALELANMKAQNEMLASQNKLADERLKAMEDDFNEKLNSLKKANASDEELKKIEEEEKKAVALKKEKELLEKAQEERRLAEEVREKNKKLEWENKKLRIQIDEPWWTQDDLNSINSIEMFETLKGLVGKDKENVYNNKGSDVGVVVGANGKTTPAKTQDDVLTEADFIKQTRDEYLQKIDSKRKYSSLII